MADLVVPSGAEVVINTAPFKDAKALHKAVLREMIGRDIDIATALTVAASNAIEAALAPCLARCLYNNQKITDQTFEKDEARGDYYAIAIACGKANTNPLFDSLFSALAENGLLKKMEVKDELPKSV